MHSTKPFFHALESILRSRLPPDEFAQVMEESLWEFESVSAANAGPARWVRLGSICVSFYRAMVKIGIPPETALEALSQAGGKLGWSAEPGAMAGSCSLATYFRSKNALPLCRSVFCANCPRQDAGCTQSVPAEDWVEA